MKQRKVVKSAGFLIVIVIALVALSSCDQNPIMANKVSDQEPAMIQGIPASEMVRIPWKPEVKEKINRLAKETISQKNVTPQAGGMVGGSQTYGNTVDIPSGALSDKTVITVQVVCGGDREQCGAEVDYLPSIQFESDVTVSLSWEYLDYDGGELDFSAYYSEDYGETWIEVEVAEIDYENKTLTIYVDHFTRFAWAL